MNVRPKRGSSTQASHLKSIGDMQNPKNRIIVVDSTPELGDLICEVISTCYAKGRKKAFLKEAAKLGGNYEQFVAAALAQLIVQRFAIHKRSTPADN